MITEALAVLEHIADTRPQAALVVISNDVMERTRLNEALADLVSNVHDAWAPVFSPERFVLDEKDRDDARQAAFKRIDGQYARLDRLMAEHEWMTLGRRTVADAYLYVMCAWKDRSPTPLAAYPALAALEARLDADPGILRALAGERST